MSEHLREEPVSSEVVFRGRLLTIRVDTVQLSNGHTSRREVVAHLGAVAMVPLIDSDHVLLVRQWRHAAGRALLEIPAGGLAPGEAPDDCVTRELMEEVGYRPQRLTALGAIYLAPGYSSELLHLFLAEVLTPERLPHDEDENLEVVCLSWAEIDALLRHGEIVDAKSIAGLLLVQQLLRERKGDARG